MKKISSVYDHVEKLVTKLLEKLSDQQNITYQVIIISSAEIQTFISIFKTYFKASVSSRNTFFSNAMKFSQDRGKEFLLSSSPIKDHIHVYTKTASKGESNYLVPFHIDNGIFLILTPFLSPSLHVKLSDGQVVK
jgi:hypothetical protein